jgi:hypothetical protein
MPELNCIELKESLNDKLKKKIDEYEDHSIHLPEVCDINDEDIVKYGIGQAFEINNNVLRLGVNNIIIETNNSNDDADNKLIIKNIDYISNEYVNFFFDKIKLYPNEISPTLGQQYTKIFFDKVVFKENNSELSELIVQYILC